MKNKIEVIALLVAIASCLIAFLAWVLPFNSVGESPFTKKEETPTLSTIVMPATALTATDLSVPSETSLPSETATLFPTDTAFATDTLLAPDTDTPLPTLEPPPTEVVHLPDPTLITTIKGASLFCSKAILCGPRFQEGDSFHAQYSITQGNPDRTEFDILGFHSYKYVVEAQASFDDVIPIDNWNAGPLTIWMINCNAEPITVEFALSGGAWNRCD